MIGITILPLQIYSSLGNHVPFFKSALNESVLVLDDHLRRVLVYIDALATVFACHLFPWKLWH